MVKHFESKSIDDLPPEILAHIFACYIKSEGNGKLCSILATVSKSWRTIALSPGLWKEINFTTKDFISEQENAWVKDQDIIERLSLVKTLNLFNPAFVQSDNVNLLDLELIFKNAPNVENFSFKSDQNFELPEFLLHLPSLCAKIKEIELEKIRFQPENNINASWIEKYSANLTKLVLTLRNVFLESCTSFAISKKVAECCPNMAHLELDIFSSDRLFALAPVQVGCPKMKKLGIKNCIFTDEDDFHSSFPYLEEFCYKPCPLKLSNVDVQQELVRVLKGSTNLERLELIDFSFKVQTMMKLPCIRLKKLYFEYFVKQPTELYEVLCHWKDSLMDIDASCSKDSQQFLFQYIDEYGKNNLEFLSLRSSFIDVGQLKELVRQCAKLRFLCFDDVRNIHKGATVLSTHKEINKWLNC